MNSKEVLRTLQAGEINLEDAKINFEGEWLSTEDLSNEIQEKLQAGDMNISGT